MPTAANLFSSIQPGNRPHDDSDWATMLQVLFGMNSGITALAGGTLAAGTPQLKYGTNVVSTVVTAGDSVALPPAVVGLWCTVINQGASSMAIFGSVNPGNNGALDVISSNVATTTAASINLATAKIMEFVCIGNGLWKALLSA